MASWSEMDVPTGFVGTVALEMVESSPDFFEIGKTSGCSMYGHHGNCYFVGLDCIWYIF